MGIGLSVAMNVRTGLSENLIKAANIGVFCVNRLDFQRDYGLFEAVKELESTKVDFRVGWYDDEGIETIKEDPYGNRLRYVLAKEFRKISYDGWSSWNKAIIEFLKSIPEDTVVILYWS